MDTNIRNFANQSETDLRIEKSFETFFGKKPQKKDLGTDQFLTNLYAYPPKFRVSSRIKKEGGTNKSVHSFLFSKPKMAQELDRAVLTKYVYSRRDYFNGYLDKNFTSEFLLNAAKPLKKLLETTPVYVVLNGQEKIVLAHDVGFGDPVIPNNKLYDMCGAFVDNGTLKRGKLGLAFLDYNDAKIFMDAALELAPEESSVVGLAIHCVSLDSVYDLIRSHHPGTDFRLIADMKNLVSSFALVRDSRFLFQEELHKLNPPPASDDEYNISDLNGSPLQNFTKGVSVYAVQLQESKRGIIKGGLRSLVSKADSFISFFVRPHRLGRKIMKGQLPKTFSNKTYLFFDYREALDFCKKNNRFVVRLSGSYLGPTFDRVIQKPIIFVTSLETLLEHWENNLTGVKNSKSSGSKSPELLSWSANVHTTLNNTHKTLQIMEAKAKITRTVEISGFQVKNEADNSEMKDFSSTFKVVPAHKSEKPWDVDKSKLLNSPGRKMCRQIKVRYKILNSFIEYLWLA